MLAYHRYKRKHFRITVRLRSHRKLINYLAEKENFY